MFVSRQDQPATTEARPAKAALHNLSTSLDSLENAVQSLLDRTEFVSSALPPKPENKQVATKEAPASNLTHIIEAQTDRVQHAAQRLLERLNQMEI